MRVHPVDALARLAELRFKGLGEAEAVPDVGALGRLLEHPRAHRRDEKGRARPLDRARIHDCVANPVVAPFEGAHLVREQEVHDRDVLAKAGGALRIRPVRDPHHVVGGVDRQAQAQPHVEASRGDVVHGEGLAREHRGVAQRNLRDAGAQADAGGLAGRRREQGPGLEPGARRIGPVHEVVRDRGDIEAERLQPPETAGELVPGRVRKGEDLKSQSGHGVLRIGGRIARRAMIRIPPAGARFSIRAR